MQKVEILHGFDQFICFLCLRPSSNTCQWHFSCLKQVWDLDCTCLAATCVLRCTHFLDTDILQDMTTLTLLGPSVLCFVSSNTLHHEMS